MSPSQDLADKTLIEGYLDGNTGYFEMLYQRYRRPLYAYLNKMLPGQPATVDDLFQQAWIKAVNRLGKYEDRQSFLSWLIRIAHNNAIDHFRKGSREQHVELDEAQVPDERGIPWKSMSQSELGQALAAAVQQLPADQREVFILRQERTPFKEIAAIQDCSLNTVLGRMHYAVQKLRLLLIEWK